MVDTADLKQFLVLHKYAHWDKYKHKYNDKSDLGKIKRVEARPVSVVEQVQVGLDLKFVYIWID